MEGGREEGRKQWKTDRFKEVGRGGERGREFNRGTIETTKQHLMWRKSCIWTDDQT